MDCRHLPYKQRPPFAVRPTRISVATIGSIPGSSPGVDCRKISFSARLVVNQLSYRVTEASNPEPSPPPGTPMEMQTLGRLQPASRASIYNQCITFEPKEDVTMRLTQIRARHRRFCTPSATLAKRRHHHHDRATRRSAQGPSADRCKYDESIVATNIQQISRLATACSARRYHILSYASLATTGNKTAFVNIGTLHGASNSSA